MNWPYREDVVKTFKLTYEAVEVLRANFDPKTSPNHWTIQSRTLKDIVEYFGPKTEQLDWYYEQGKVVFTSYTEKVSDGRRKLSVSRCVKMLSPFLEILKQPLHTSVAIERKEFDDFSVQEGLHIGIVVRDFKAIVAHADTLHADITARYAQGNRPMQLSYQNDGLLCEYTLMTRGQSMVVPTASNMQTPARDLSVRPSPRQSQRHEQGQASARPARNMPPPTEVSNRKASHKVPERRTAQPSPPPAPSASLNHDSLFMPANDDERQWDAPDYNDDDDDGEQLFWDQTQQFVSQVAKYQRSSTGAKLLFKGTSSSRRIRDSEPSTVFPSFQAKHEEMAIAPTQRLSGVCFQVHLLYSLVTCVTRFEVFSTKTLKSQSTSRAGPKCFSGFESIAMQSRGFMPGVQAAFE